MPTLRRRTLLASGAALALPSGIALAQDGYPGKPLTFIVASVAGGILDTVGRIVAKGLEDMGQPVVVQNIPGGGSAIGTAAVVRAPADGYTVGMVATSHAINPSVYAKLPFDTERDLTGISQSVALVNMLVVNPGVPARTLQEFVALAKSRPNTLTHGSAGAGQSNHLSGELFGTEAGIRMTHVPYKGSAAAMNDLLGGSIGCMFVDALSALPHIQAGKLRALAISSRQRLPIAPEVPTFAESGYPRFDANSWLGVVVRSGTPPAIVARLGEYAGKAVANPDARARLEKLGVLPVGSTPSQFTAFIHTEIARYAAAVKAAGIQPQ